MARDLGFKSSNLHHFYFVSYNSEDNHRIGKICQKIHQKGVSLWYDNGLHVGNKWEIEIADQIQKCQALLLFFTHKMLSKDYSYVQKEFKTASFFKKPVYIIMVDYITDDEIPVNMVPWWIDIKEMQNLDVSQEKDVDKIADRIISETGLIQYRTTATTVQEHTSPDNTIVTSTDVPSKDSSVDQIQNYDDLKKEMSYAPAIFGFNELIERKRKVCHFSQVMDIISEQVEKIRDYHTSILELKKALSNGELSEDRCTGHITANQEEIERLDRTIMHHLNMCWTNDLWICNFKNTPALTDEIISLIMLQDSCRIYPEIIHEASIIINDIKRKLDQYLNALNTMLFDRYRILSEEVNKSTGPLFTDISTMSLDSEKDQKIIYDAIGRLKEFIDNQFVDDSEHHITIKTLKKMQTEYDNWKSYVMLKDMEIDTFRKQSPIGNYFSAVHMK